MPVSYCGEYACVVLYSRMDPRDDIETVGQPGRDEKHVGPGLRTVRRVRVAEGGDPRRRSTTTSRMMRKCSGSAWQPLRRPLKVKSAEGPLPRDRVELFHVGVPAPRQKTGLWVENFDERTPLVLCSQRGLIRRQPGIFVSFVGIRQTCCSPDTAVSWRRNERYY